MIQRILLAAILLCLLPRPSGAVTFWADWAHGYEPDKLLRLSHDPYDKESVVRPPGRLAGLWQDRSERPWILVNAAQGAQTLYRLEGERWQAVPLEPLLARQRPLLQAFGKTGKGRLGRLLFTDAGPLPIPAGIQVLLTPDGLWASDGARLLLLSRSGRLRRRIPDSAGFVPRLLQRDGTLWAWHAGSDTCLEIGARRLRRQRDCGEPVFLDARGRPGFLHLDSERGGRIPVALSLLEAGRRRRLTLSGFRVDDERRDPDPHEAYDDGQGRLWLLFERGLQRIDPVRGERVSINLARHDGPGGKFYWYHYRATRGDATYFLVTGYDSGHCICPEPPKLELWRETDFRDGLPNYDGNPSAEITRLNW